MKKTLNLGIVGCGDIATYLASLALLTPGVQVAACCDINLGAAQQFAARFRIPAAYGDYTALLDHPGLDAVYLAVPHDLHLPMVRQAVEHRLPVFCEKPLAATLAEGRELVEVVQRTGIKVAINYQYRYDSACYGLATLARRGDLGQVLYARANIPWHREIDYFNKNAAWHSLKHRAGGGTLITQGSHFLDLLLWATESRPVTAFGLTTNRRIKEVEVEDLAFGLVELENGAIIEITSSMVATPEQTATLELYAEKGTALYRAGLRPRLELRGVHLSAPKPPVRGLHALQRSLNAFCAWVLEDRPTLNPVEEACKTLAVVDAIYRSAESGKKELIS